MDLDYSFLRSFLGTSPVERVGMAFSIGCTLWLIVLRIRGCFRVRRENPVRDVGLLFAAPISFGLMAACKALVVAASDPEFGPRLGGFPAAYCGNALLCFILNVLAVSLPAKEVSP